MAVRTSAQIRLKIELEDGVRLGPGKMDLLEEVERCGSISGAGRALGMSYRRAWVLIDQVNTMFSEPAVKASAGGAHGGGATLTPFGAALLDAYRTVERNAQASANAAFAPIRSKISRRNQA